MNRDSHEPLGYGLIGCGAFGRFCLDQYKTMPEIRIVAAADVNADAVADVAKKFGIVPCKSVAELLARDDVDIVHIATPPSTHVETVGAALRAGKHVLCEKPLATDLDSAKKMVALSQDAGLLLAVNLIMRYNPLCEIVKRIVDDRMLGEPLHGFFENYAKDEPLGPDHWFWNRDMSGGIFIEHGVHFFDLFQWWLGDGSVRAAQATKRPGTDIVEQVHCTVSHGDVLVNFYHGFHQAARMDRQEMRIVFERGTLRLFEWVPTSIEIDAILDQETFDSLTALFADLRNAVAVETYTGADRHVTSRHKKYEVDGRYNITAGVGMTKPELYGHILRGLMADQVAAINSPDHKRRVTEQNGVTSLEMAVRATEMAQSSKRKHK